MTSRPTPRLATGLLAGFLSFALAPAAQAGTVSVVEGVLTITASPNETNIITVERMDNESVVQLGQPATREVIFVRDATNPTTTPVPGLPINPGAILTPGVGCQTVTEPDPNSRRPPIKCTAADFTAINATLSTQQDQDAEATDAERDSDFFSEVDTKKAKTPGQDYTLPPASISGGAGKDILRGTSAADTLDGGSSDDQLYGLGADDLLRPGAGENDPIAGDDGIDTVDYATSTRDLTIIVDGLANDGESGKDNVKVGVENITTGSGNDVIETSTAALNANVPNRVQSGAGDDKIKTFAGDDTVIAGEGANTIFTGDGDDKNGTSGAGNDVVDLGAGDDSFNAGAGDNKVDGQAGADSVTTGGGADTINGGDGDDVTLAAGDGVNTVTGGNGLDTITAGTGGDSINGGADKDTITAGAGDNNVNGDTGDDVITALGGKDTINGDQGLDNINAGDGDNTVRGGSDADTVTTGSGIDTVFGDGGADTLTTGAGHDLITGGADADTIDAGTNPDTNVRTESGIFVVGDLVSYADKSAPVKADLSSAAADNGTGCLPGSTTGCEGDKLTGAESLLGGTGSDVLTGTAANGSTANGANALNGGAGNGDDVLQGKTGSDDLLGGAGYDEVSYEERVNSVTVTLDGNKGDGESGEDDNVRGDIERVKGGSAGDFLTGSDQRNDLLGLGGNDELNGQKGPDLLDGGEGDEDRVSYAGRDDAVTVITDNLANDGSAQDTSDGTDGLPAGSRDKVLNTVENLTGGNAGDSLTTTGLVNNELDGGNGDDLLDGGLGADDLIGGLGNDTVAYTGRTTTVVAQLDGVRNDGEGAFDGSTGITSAERDLIAEDVESLRGDGQRDVFIGTPVGSNVFDGRGGNDLLQGGSRGDLLTGGDGNDEILGGAGDDVLSGGAGTDALNGEAGFDRATDADQATEQVQSIEAFGGLAALPARPATATATTTQQPAQQQTTTTTTQQPAQQQTTTTTTQQQSTTTQSKPATTTSGGSTSGGSTSGSGAATEQTPVKVIPVGAVAGTTQGQRSLQSIKTTKSGTKVLARVRGTVADRSCKRGQTVTIKVLAGRKVVGTKSVKLGKGCTFNALVPVKTSAKMVTATVSMAGSKSLRTR